MIRMILALCVLGLFSSNAFAQIETTAQKLARLRQDSRFQLETLADVVGELANDLDTTKAVAANAQRDANAALAQNTALKGMLEARLDAIDKNLAELKANRDSRTQVGEDWAGDPVWQAGPSSSGTWSPSSSGYSGGMMMQRQGLFRRLFRRGGMLMGGGGVSGGGMLMGGGRSGST